MAQTAAPRPGGTRTSHERGPAVRPQAEHLRGAGPILEKRS